MRTICVGHRLATLILSLIPYLIFFQLIQLLPVAVADVYVGFPFSEQLPNVARVNESYSFTMANVTYKSTLDDGLISYQVLNTPAWLQFDSGSRSFLGTPSSSDLGTFDITLTGFDSQNNSLANNYSMIVSDLPGIKLSSDDVMFSQVALYGRTNGRNGLVVQQGQKINIAFDSSVFAQNNPDSDDAVVAYYGRSADRSSLPPWIKYNLNDMSFVGTVPYVVSDIAPSTNYNFAFIASDIKGFAAAVGYFELVVGFHTLSTSQNDTEKINGTLNMSIDYTIPILEEVYLDNSLVQRENISLVYANDLPSYVSFNETDYGLSGTFPNDSTVDNFVITVNDVFGNSVELPYQLEAMASLFTLNELPDLNATKGEFFSHQLLKSYFTDFNSTTISVDTDNQSWLEFHSSNLTLNGNVPDNFDSSEITVSASSNSKTNSKSFQIKGVSKSETTTSSSTSSSSSSTSKPSSTSSASATSTLSSTSSSGKHKKDNKKLIIGLAVGIPAFALLVALALILFCCIRRKKNGEEPEDVEKLPPMSVLPNEKSRHMKEQADQLDALKQFELHKSGLTPIIGGPGKKVDDINSVSSSLTHVDSRDQYFDTSDKPLMSWRANDDEDSKNIVKDESVILAGGQNPDFRKSDATMSTVNTERLFSVRLVDDVSARDSQRSLMSGVMSRDSSGNFQRLDSDGNIVQNGKSASYLDIVDEVTEEANTTGGSTLPNTSEISKLKARDRSTPPVLDEHDILLRPNVEIFNAEDPPNTANATGASSVYHSLREDSNQTIDSAMSHSSYNLLGKLTEMPHPNIHDNSIHPDESIEEADNESSGTPSPMGGEPTNKSSDIIQTFPFHSSIDNINGIPMISPMSESSTLGKSPHTSSQIDSPKYGAFKLNTSEAGISVDSNGNPKLVAFTRKASLRDSSYEPDHAALSRAETAVIHNSDSE